MSKSVGINPPKTPCTTEVRGMAKCTIPNICKMPGPPAPFIPTPLPNIGKSSLSPKGYTTTVKLEGQTVAIRGATFESIGDIASKGTGGGLISCNTHGPTKFITPGSMNVKMEGKNVHLLGEPMLNNCGPSGSPPNTGATMQGFDTHRSGKPQPIETGPDCSAVGWNPNDPCRCKQVCAMVKAYNSSTKQKKKVKPSPSNKKSELHNQYKGGKSKFTKEFAALVREIRKESRPPNLDDPRIKKMFHDDCLHAEWKRKGGRAKPSRSHPNGMNPDHKHPASLNGSLKTDNLVWGSADVNQLVGTEMDKAVSNNRGRAPKSFKAHSSCGCGS